MAKYKIGFVDENVQQVDMFERKLRDHFDVIGYDIHEGILIDELIDQIYESDIDMLMVDYNMVESGKIFFNGDEVVRKYEELKPRFPMIIFTNFDEQAFPKVDNPNTLYKKEFAIQELDKFVQTLEKNIRIYRDYVGKRKAAIDKLLEKSSKETLNGKEKHELTQAQLELLGLDRRANEVPVNLISDQKIDNLEKTARDAEAFLESLKDLEDDDAATKK